MSEERRIYKWLGFFEPYASRNSATGGLQWWSRHGRNVSSGRIGIHPLPPLDYNTLHNDVAPRLQTEGYEITWTGIDGKWYIDPIVSTAEINRDVTESVAAAAALALTGKVPSWYLSAESLEGRVQERFSALDWREALDLYLESHERNERMEGR